MQKLILNLQPKFFNRHSLAHQIHRLVILSLITLLTLAFSGLKSSAQEVRELGQMLSSMKSSATTETQIEAKRIESLVYELHPSVKIENGVISTYADAPYVCIDVDAQSIDKIKETNILYSQIELLTIRINNQSDLNMVLDLASLKGFTSLKYVNLLCSFDCSVQQVSKLVKISASKISVFYIVSIPS
jgi:hypothetical protein